MKCPWGFPGGSVVKESTCRRYRRCRFNPWVGRISWKRVDPLEEEMATNPAFLPGNSHEQRSLAGCSPWDLKRNGHDWAINWLCMKCLITYTEWSSQMFVKRLCSIRPRIRHCSVIYYYLFSLLPYIWVES